MKAKANKGKSHRREFDRPPEAQAGRSDWELNHGKIRDAMLALIAEQKGKIPSQESIAERAGLSRITVQRHMRQMDLAKIAKPFRVLADTVLLGLANRAIRGDTAAAKLFFKLTFGEKDDDSKPSDWEGE